MLRIIELLVVTVFAVNALLYRCTPYRIKNASSLSGFKDKLIKKVRQNEVKSDKLPVTVKLDELKLGVERIINEEALKTGFIARIINWYAERIEVIVSDGREKDTGYAEINAEQMQELHRRIYEQLELKELVGWSTISRYELIIATPGVGEVLNTEKDFISFQGFPVAVYTSEEFKKKVCHEGTLVGRTDEFVKITNKGRITSIPRSIVTLVKLPKSKIEPGDTEMMKLRDTM